MCYHAETTYNVNSLKERYKARPSEEFKSKPQTNVYCNGFTKPQMPIIKQESPSEVHLFNWWLIPFWTKKEKLYKYNTLNAKAETIHSLPSFRECIKSRRCVIPTTSFYEWKWNDSKGKSKTKFQIGVNEEVFSLAGIYDSWVDRETGEIFNTFAIITTRANPMMAKIHNTKKRMPVILKPEDENKWLDIQEPIGNFAYPYTVRLSAQYEMF